MEPNTINFLIAALVFFIGLSALLYFLIGKKNSTIKNLLTENQELKSWKAAQELAQNEIENWKQVATQSMESQFKGLAFDVLEHSNKRFLEMAQTQIQKAQDDSQHIIDKKALDIKHLVEPIKQNLTKYESYLKELEKMRMTQDQRLSHEIVQMTQVSESLRQETNTLKMALKKPHVRGRWGEIQLKNCVELAGMSEFCDFNTQDTHTTGEGQKLIPDMTIKMPNGHVLVVDAKTPMDAYLDYVEAQTDTEKEENLLRHAKQIKTHIKSLGLKAYSDHLETAADFTIMFLPNESFLYAALETEKNLVEQAIEKNILITSPPTFIGLLKVLYHGWNEKKLAENALKISDTGKELHKRLSEFIEGYINIGKQLSRAQDEYDKGLNRLQSRVILQAKRLEELGAKSSKDIDLEEAIALPTLDEKTTVKEEKSKKKKPKKKASAPEANA